MDKMLDVTALENSVELYLVNKIFSAFFQVLEADILLITVMQRHLNSSKENLSPLFTIFP